MDKKITHLALLLWHLQLIPQGRYLLPVLLFALCVQFNVLLYAVAPNEPRVTSQASYAAEEQQPPREQSSLSI